MWVKICSVSLCCANKGQCVIKWLLKSAREEYGSALGRMIASNTSFGIMSANSEFYWWDPGKPWLTKNLVLVQKIMKEESICGEGGKCLLAEVIIERLRQKDEAVSLVCWLWLAGHQEQTMGNRSWWRKSSFKKDEIFFPWSERITYWKCSAAKLQ